MAVGFHFQFTVSNANRLLFLLIAFEAFLVLVYALGIFLEMPRVIHRSFNLDGEATIPAWFSSMQLFAIGVLFLFSGYWSQAHRVVNPWLLLIIGAGFIFLSMDEAAAIHEKITGTLRHVEWMPRFEGEHGIWIPIYMTVAGVMAVAGGRTLVSMLKVYPRESIIMFSGLIIFLVGGIGMEIISYWYLRDTGMPSLYKLEVALEEFFEMAGASLVLYGAVLCAVREPVISGSGHPASPPGP